MISPTTKSLCTAFPDLSERVGRYTKAGLIKALCAAADDRERLAGLLELPGLEATAAYRRQCHNEPLATGTWRRTMVLHAVDSLLGTYGVEPLFSPSQSPAYEYCNAGDTYSTTLIYKRASDRLFIGCWGDIAERYS